MISRGELRERAPAESRYVYVKMLRPQADTQLGKVGKGEILIMDEAKASRWCFRSRVARPATEEEFNRYQDRQAREANRTGQLVRRPMNLPTENPFTYVEDNGEEFDDDSVVDDGSDGPTLADRLEDAESEDFSEEEESDEETDEDAVEVSDDGPGVYNASISGGPGESRRRGRRGRNRNQDDSEEE